MSQKHIAASGASAGKWVVCNAKIQCRNGGLHVDSAGIAKVAKALGKKVSEVTLDDVKNPAPKLRNTPSSTTSARKSAVFLPTEVPEELAEPFSAQSLLTKSVQNRSLPGEDEITVEYYDNEVAQIVSLMQKDPRWTQAEKEAQSIMKKMRVEEELRKGRGIMSNEYGDFMVGDDFPITNCAPRDVVELFAASWSMGSSMDNGLKIAFGHALYDNFDMGKSDFKSDWKSHELYNQNRTFFKVATESIYQHTQTKLTEKTYRLARLTDKGSLRPISSFTGKHKVISQFNAENIDYVNENTIVIYADVPKERIFGFYGTALGTAYQSEFIVLGAGRKLPALQNYQSVSMPMKRKKVATAAPVKAPVPAKVPEKRDIVAEQPPKKKGFWARLLGL